MGAQAFNLVNYIVAGALVGTSMHCFFFNLSSKHGRTYIAILKAIMCFCFFVEPLTSVFLDLDLGIVGCAATGKFNTISFHVAMICIDAVLLSRANVVLGRTSLVGKVMSMVWLGLRITVAAADCYFSIVNYDHAAGLCLYNQNFVTGVLYLINDMTIDLYVSGAICVKLYEAIQARKKMRVVGNVYNVLIESNLFRTVIIFSSNFIQFLAIILKFEGLWLLIFWSVSDLAYLYLVTYDTALIRFMSTSNTSRNGTNQLASINQGQNHIPMTIKQSVHVQQEFEMTDHEMFPHGEGFEKGDVPLTKY